MPLALHGPHSIGNLVMACKSCNSRKSKLHPDAWRKRSGFTFSAPKCPNGHFALAADSVL
jgi:hypothetical protein